MKKYRNIIIFTVILILVGLLFVIKFTIVSRNQSIFHQTQLAEQQPLVDVSIETGDTTVTEKNIPAASAYDSLVVITNNKQIALKTKKYDFGIFVEQIGTLTNTNEKSWIYFVNGKSGTAAADKQKVKTGDIIEWKYIKPIF